MHLTGKIFAFLTLCLAIAAIILTAQTLDKQNEWNQRVEKARKAYEESAAKLPDAEARVTQLKDELALLRLDWGRHWDDVEVAAGTNIGRGLINIGIGRNQGLSMQTEQGEQFPLMYGFQELPDGEMSYVGEFRVTQVDVNRAALQLARQPREGETATWNFNSKWRFHDQIPPAKRQAVGDLLLRMTVMEQRLADRRQSLAIQQQSVAAAQSALEQRMKELEGNENAPQGAPDEYRLGLLATLDAAEEQRNAALADIQQLRKQLDTLNSRFEQLLTANSELERKLSTSSSTAAAPQGAANN